MKKLDKLVLKAFIGPFTITFCVVVFIFLTQFLMNYFDQLIGKDLGFMVYAKLIFYFAMTMTPIALPLAILLACLITFGNLGEHMELTAIKSAGISLVRVLFPMFLFALTMVFVSFWFNNNLIPKFNLKAFSLLYDIRQKKPALEFKDGVFYNGLPDYSIRVGHKEPETQKLNDLMIYDHTEGKGNSQVILAKSGYMDMLHDGAYLKLTLFDGTMYQMTAPKVRRKNDEQFTTVKFAKNEMMFPMQSFSFERTDENLFKPHRVMNNVSELTEKVDSFELARTSLVNSLFKNVSSFYGYNLRTDKFEDRNLHPETYVESGDGHELSEKQEKEVIRKAQVMTRNLKSFTQSYATQLKNRNKEISSYRVEKIKKFTYAVACLAMFIIGAPLGSIIKKGGLGVPVLVAIVFFVIYHIISITGEKMSKEGLIDPYQGMWTANMILFSIGVFFLYKARKDSALFDSDYYSVTIDKIKALFKSKTI